MKKNTANKSSIKTLKLSFKSTTFYRKTTFKIKKQSAVAEQ